MPNMSYSKEDMDKRLRLPTLDKPDVSGKADTCRKSPKYEVGTLYILLPLPPPPSVSAVRATRAAAL